MTALATVELPLPALIDRAVSALANARTSAEVLEARDMAALAYDAAKRAARIGRAKQAHDSLIAAAHRTQADALEIEAAAKRKLADEYDAAQERGEVGKQGAHFSDGKMRASEILPPKQLHEARQIRDAEKAQPGIVKQALDKIINAGEEPTRAKVKRVVKAKANRARKPNGHKLKVQESQHDRDLRMLMGVWEAACESAREEFLRTVGG